MDKQPTFRKFDPAQLTRFCASVLTASGFPEEVAEQTADVLVWADLRGQSSHGVMRLPGYLAWARNGIIDIAAEPRVARQAGAIVVVEGGQGLGPWVLARAADLAVDKARETSIGWVLVRNHTHAGAIGYFARRIAEAGMMSMVMTASRPLMAYYGTRGPAAATNPLAIGMPGGWLFDMSTAAISMGKLASAAAAATPLPEGVAADAEGNPTLDPAEAAIPLPLGGPKGAGLSVMIECLTSLALANPLLAPSLADQREGREVRHRQNGLLVAIDPSALGELVDLASATAELDAALKAEPLAPGFGEILHPGERGDRAAAEQRRSGVRLAARTVAQLVELATALNVKIPAFCEN